MNLLLRNAALLLLGTGLFFAAVWTHFEPSFALWRIFVGLGFFASLSDIAIRLVVVNAKYSGGLAIGLTVIAVWGVLAVVALRLGKGSMISHAAGVSLYQWMYVAARMCGSTAIMMALPARRLVVNSERKCSK